MHPTSSRTGHLPINGVDLFYEVHGELGTSEKPPLLLIPGAFMATESMTTWVAAFAQTRTVIVFDNRGTAAPRTPRGRCRTSSSPTMQRHYYVRWRSTARR